MNKVEIDTFIETTGEFGDVWTIEQVQDVYGDKTLSEALLIVEHPTNIWLV